MVVRADREKVEIQISSKTRDQTPEWSTGQPDIMGQVLDSCLQGKALPIAALIPLAPKKEASSVSQGF